MMLLDIRFCVRVEILDQICQNIDGRFSGRERGDIIILDVGRR